MKRHLAFNSMVLMALASAGADAAAQTPGATSPPDGKTMFAKNCAACHQVSGAGIPGAFPALKANKFVQGDAAVVIATVLKGRGGMPSFAASLDDTQLSLAISYIRQAWGNQATPVSAEDIAAVRSAGDMAASKPKETPSNAH